MSPLRFLIFIGVLLSGGPIAFGQIPDSCKLNFGTNLAGLADYGTEIPFVDLMRTSRTWYTKSVGDPNDPFNSGFKDEMTFREDGYPTHVPQNVPGSDYPQRVVTIWAITDGWPAGAYTVLWEGDGELSFWGGHKNLKQTGDHRIVFDFPTPKEGILEMTIRRSEKDNPIRNIRVLMPGTESTYQTQPFYDLWLEKLQPFNSVRFMDWGQTNNWGQSGPGDIADDNLVDWAERSQMDHYTWAYNKGVPYEMMVALMNQENIDGWVCVPHTASEDYIRKMARYFRDHLKPDLNITVEYSNEIWNWIFGQTHWTNKYGVEETDAIWPEGTVPFIQRMLDYWTDEFDGELHRTTRVVGVQTGWTDVAERVVRNVDPESFDAVAPTYYFSFNEDGDETLDNLGSAATVADVARFVRQNMTQGVHFIEEVQTIASSLGKTLAFYEGGQHFTPHPFGVEPSYAQALLDIQRDTAMYHLYQEWFSALRSIHQGDEPWLMMNFSFVSARSARYGSWGILESMDQDTDLIPAPKYKAIIEAVQSYKGCEVRTSTAENKWMDSSIVVFPNPASGTVRFSGLEGAFRVAVMDTTGCTLKTTLIHPGDSLDIQDVPHGVVFLKLTDLRTGAVVHRKVVKTN